MGFRAGSTLAAIELAYAENVTGVATAAAGIVGAIGVAVDIPGCDIVVPATLERDVYIEGECKGAQTALGIGEAIIQLIETTGGAVSVEWSYHFLPNSASNRGKSLPLSVQAKIGPTLAVRTFKLMIRCDSIVTNTPSWSALNIAAARSYIRAWAE